MTYVTSKVPSEVSQEVQDSKLRQTWFALDPADFADEREMAKAAIEKSGFGGTPEMLLKRLGYNQDTPCLVALMPMRAI